MMFLDCPAYQDRHGTARCGLPAEVSCRFTMRSTDGPIESARIRCPAGHYFCGAIESLTWNRNDGHGPGSATVTSRAGPVGIPASHDCPHGADGSAARDVAAEPDPDFSRPNTAPASYLGRPARLWITVMRPRRRRTPSRHPMPTATGGGPSVPNWLAGRAGPDGKVLATDIDTSWIDGVAPHVEVRRHDIARDDLPPGGFDLIHARLVLCWIPERDKALRRMAGALRPGGWLLIEDFDPALQSAACIDAYLPDHHNANKLRAGFGALVAQTGADPAYGRKLPRLLTEQGLADVAADAYMPVSLPAAGALDLSNFDQLHDTMLAQGLATAEEIDSHGAAVDRGTGFATPPLISAWGRKPS